MVLESVVKKLGHELKVQGTKFANNLLFPEIDYSSHKNAIAGHAGLGLMYGIGTMAALMAFRIYDHGAPLIALGGGVVVGVGKYYAQEAYYSFRHRHKYDG